ncbi:hypothetical protein C8R47DRAFT_1072008 [Mycena vitilis]|nr:hypothetical protein C8R47DRAFT_1072008 [Mycena vitilis]
MDFDFDFDPAWSEHTLPRRGKAVLLDVKLVDVIEQELENSDRRFIAEAPFRTVAWYLRDTSPIPAETDTEAGFETATQDGTDSDCATDLDTTGPPQASSEPDTDTGLDYSALDTGDEEKMLTAEDSDSSTDYTASPSPFAFDRSHVPSAEWSEGFISHFSPFSLHRRELTAVQAMTAVPDTVNVAHLEMLGFKKIVWDDPRPFVDLQDRIGAFFLGPPHQRTQWETAVMGANDAMRSVRPALGPLPDETLRGGFEHGAKGVERPQNFSHPDPHLVALAKLRHSADIQEITSFQNERLCPSPTVSPMPWTAFPAHRVLASGHLRDRATGWTAVTSVGDYDATESALILWRERRFVRFPPGSTFLFPAGLFSYSFTGISEYSSRMLIIQSFDGEIARFVEGGMSDKPKLPKLFTDEAWEADRQRRAKRAFKIFPTLNGYDHRSQYA